MRPYLFTAATGCSFLVALVLGAVTLALISQSVGWSSTVVAILMATVPLPIYVGLVLWLDRFEAEPAGMLLGAFVWGAAVAAFFSGLVNSFNQILAYVVVGLLTGHEGLATASAQFFTAVVSAPLVEETSKGLFLLLLFWFRRREFDGIVDGVIYATMVSLGFAAMENVSYYGSSLSEMGAGGAAVTFGLRGVLAPYSHPLFTSMTGIGLGWARETGNPAVRWLAPPGGLLLAMGLHSLWNFTAILSGWLWLVVYFLIMIPLLAAVLGVVFFALAREGELVRRYLAQDVETGVVSAEDYELLPSVGRRLAASWQAFRQGGFAGWWRREKFHQLTSELAFLRHRAARAEIAPGKAQQLESEYLGRLQAL